MVKLPLPGLHMTAFSLYPHMMERVTELPGVSFIWTLIYSFMRAPSSWPIHFLKIPLPNTIMLGLEFKHKNSVQMQTFDL